MDKLVRSTEKKKKKTKAARHWGITTVHYVSRGTSHTNIDSIRTAPWESRKSQTAGSTRSSVGDSPTVKGPEVRAPKTSPKTQEKIKCCVSEEKPERKQKSKKFFELLWLSTLKTQDK